MVTPDPRAPWRRNHADWSLKRADRRREIDGSARRARLVVWIVFSMIAAMALLVDYLLQ